MLTYKKVNKFILLISMIKLIKHLVTISILILRPVIWKSCFWEKVKVFISLGKRGFMLKLKKVIKFWSELEEDICILMSSFISILKLKSKKLKGEMYWPDSKIRRQFRTFRYTNRTKDMKRTQLDLQEKQPQWDKKVAAHIKSKQKVQSKDKEEVPVLSAHQWKNH